MDKQTSDNQNSSYRMDKVMQYLDEVGFKMHPVVKKGKLYCSQTEETFNPEELSLVGSFRFEDASDPDELSVLYAIQANNGARAVLADSYGIYSDPEVADFLSQIKDERANSPLMDSIPPRKTIFISVH